MTKGKPRSTRTFDLSMIFFKIRESRCMKTRRSWMRRARIALAKLENLTDQDRHEIICVWSRSNASQIASEAMKKVLPRLPHHLEGKTLKSGCFLRQRFDHDGSRIKKPSLRGLAANDPIFNADYIACRTDQPLDNSPLDSEYCTLHHVVFLSALLRPLVDNALNFHRDNGAPHFLNDNYVYRHCQHGQLRHRERSENKSEEFDFSFSPQLITVSDFSIYKVSGLTAL